ncbi:P-loop containing nucleoside triphosphate hydrolase protein [Boeremia exigua]|uniref:P-loop containing nucleoside triphosphate hydrolase protein n=1 Tax=Boeremia exigua TaxID=749465 RepID=UPI001E8D2435|nr:P-loop containing nucleoside triphosphate hydrolase protein [Boeremia exigua]KAH6629648.1 P-loop containing nucleoside triphosphate hydrolase protein [Boeremia exigua]
MALSNHELERSMILVMGVTGSGKSYFINKLAKGSVVEGHGVRSETSDCQIVQVAVGSDVVALVDTPGFDDTQRSDSEILEQIVEFLCAQYKLGIPLKGIIYMHRITDNKMSGSARRYLEMFTRLCGDRNLENVVLLTTMWSELKDQGKGMERERELRREFWDAMESRGSKIRKFDGTQSMASALVHRLQRKPDIVLEIQEQLVDEGRQLDQTEAGKLMVPQIEVAIEKSEQKLRDLSKRGNLGVGRSRSEVKELEQQRGSLVEQRKRLQSRPGETISEKIEGQRKRDRMMSKLSIFGTVLGVALTMTVNVILPLVGVI